MKNRVLWGLQILVAAAFLAAGTAKLLGAPMMVETFEKVGIGQWFRYVTAGLEIAGALALLTARFSGFGAGLLAWIMVCAVLTHLLLIGGSPVPALVLLTATAFIASVRLKPQIASVTAGK